MRYDCDFNQQLDLGLGRGLSVFDVTSLDEAKLKDVVPGRDGSDGQKGWVFFRTGRLQYLGSNGVEVEVSATPEVFFSAPCRTVSSCFIMFIEFCSSS